MSYIIAAATLRQLKGIDKGEEESSHVNLYKSNQVTTTT